MRPFAAVALSGGVDSLVAAWLLKQQGYNVQGLHFLTGFEAYSSSAGAATFGNAEDAARRRLAPLCDTLAIPLQILDCRRPFKALVVDYFTHTYRNGQTPNPCIICNAAIKFGILLEHAQRVGALFLATGHYARLQHGPSNELHLLKGFDSRKDQSYFLARLSPAQLKHACFPLGNTTKTDVKALAAQQGLTPVSNTESQDVCFIPHRNYASFLTAQGVIGRPGDIVDQSGAILGRHNGLHRFTIGQRKGVNCPAAAPYYVLALDHSANRLVVGCKADIYRNGCRLEQLEWIQPVAVSTLEVDVRLRYRQQAVKARLILEHKQNARLEFEAPQASVTPGQCAVFYRDSEVMGSGWIA